MSYSIIAQLKFKKPTDEIGTIIIRGFLNRKPVAAKSTGYKVSRNDWDPVKRQLLLHAPNATLLNLSINKKLQDIQASLLQKELMGAAINKQHIIQAVNGLQHSRQFTVYCKLKIETDYKNPGTKRALTSQCEKIDLFHPGLCFYDIDFNWLTRYKKHMEEKLDNKPNTVWSSLKFVNTMIRKAIRDGGIIAANPFTDFDRGKCSPGNRKPLTLQECNSIYELVVKTEADNKIKAVACRFMLMVYSGMRFGDAMKFNPVTDLQNGRLVMQYGKWNESVNFILHNKLTEIADLIKQYPLSLSNADFNRWLKIIAAMCNINKRLSSHVGRHTMGFLLSEMNVPKEKAQKILGHKDERSTNIYYHITDGQVDREVEKLNVL